MTKALDPQPTKCVDCNEKQLTACQIAHGTFRCDSCTKKKLRKERTCKLCGKEFIGSRNTCAPCGNHRPAYRFLYSKRIADERKITWSLTKEEYTEAIIPPCHYCNGALGQVLSSCGLDRIDNTKGYELGNIVSCCQLCNRVKGDNFTQEETKLMIDVLLTFRLQCLKPGAK